MNTDGYMLNGVLVTVFKQWAVKLMEREAKGEYLPHLSKTGWREALNYPLDTDVADAMRERIAA